MSDPTAVPLTWSTILAGAGAVLTPLGLALRWMYDAGKSGSKDAEERSDRLMAKLERQNTEQAARIEELTGRVEQLRDLVSYLLTQLQIAGINPDLSKVPKIPGISGD